MENLSTICNLVTLRLSLGVCVLKFIASQIVWMKSESPYSLLIYRVCALLQTEPPYSSFRCIGAAFSSRLNPLHFVLPSVVCVVNGNAKFNDLWTHFHSFTFQLPLHFNSVMGGLRFNDRCKPYATCTHLESLYDSGSYWGLRFKRQMQD